jgi:hypothetical protein
MYSVLRADINGVYYSRTETASTNRAVWNSSAWYHIAVTFSAKEGSITFCVNRTIDQVLTLTVPWGNRLIGLDYRSASLNVGGYPTFKYMFEGLIDDVRLWNVSKPQSEIMRFWNRTLTPSDRSQSALIGYWRFDEENGVESRDLSLQGNNAMLGLDPFNPEWVSRGAPIMRTPFWTDLNDDGFVNILDVFVVANAYGSKQGDPSWNAIADLDKNGIVNILDVFAIAWDYGKIV